MLFQSYQRGADAYAKKVKRRTRKARPQASATTLVRDGLASPSMAIFMSLGTTASERLWQGQEAEEVRNCVLMGHGCGACVWVCVCAACCGAIWKNAGLWCYR